MTNPLTKEQVFELAKNAKLFAGNLIVGNSSQATMDNTTPIDNSVIGQIVDGTAEDVNQAVIAARACFDSGEWKDKHPAERKRIMQAWTRLMETHKEELAALDCIDAGKPIDECLNTDMPATLDTFDWYAESVDKVFGKVAPTGVDAFSWIVKEPIGGGR